MSNHTPQDPKGPNIPKEPGASKGPRDRKGSRASWLTLLVALAIAAIYLVNNGALALLLPDLYPPTSDPAAVATATSVAATVTAEFLVGTPETFLTTPTPLPAADEAAASSDSAAVAEAPAQEQAPPASPTKPPTSAPTATQTPAPTHSPAPTRTPTRAPTSTPTARPAVPARINGLPTITLDALPPEALETIDLIDSDGPFPFDKDGATFQNREGILPGERRGFYREYTVITPGEGDRGARRIVAGADGTLYYTDDHYESFRVVVREP